MLVDTASHSSSTANTSTHGRLSSSSSSALGGSFRSSKKQRKIVVAGSRAVGKSAVTIQFAEDRFVENYNPTIESTFQKVIVYNNTRYETDIVDTAGQDEYTIFQPQYALGVDGYVLVYSITNRQSFDVIRVINDKILSSTGNEHVPRILVANKCDLMGQRKVSTEEGERLAKDLGIPFLECSAKLNNQIGEIFKKLLVLIEGGSLDEQPKDKKGGGCTIC